MSWMYPVCAGLICVLAVPAWAQDVTPPVIDPFTVHVDLALQRNPTLVLPFEAQLMASDNVTAASNLVWSDLSYLAGPGKIAAGSADPLLFADGLFSWDPRGWKMGLHEWSAQVTDEADNTAAGPALTVDLWVPEPALMGLVGSAVIGLLGLVRRRT